MSFWVQSFKTGSAISIETIKKDNPNFDFVDDTADPKKYFEFDELNNEFNSLLNDLNLKDRFLYVEIKINGLTEREVAKKLGISQPAVHKKLLRISKYIKEKLQKFIN